MCGGVTPSIRTRAEFGALKRTDRPDLSGGIAYLDSPRHANYVNYEAYISYLAELRDRFAWPDLDEHTYQRLRRPDPTTGAAPTMAGANP